MTYAAASTDLATGGWFGFGAMLIFFDKLLS